MSIILIWPASFYRKQVKKLGQFFGLSFFWGFFQWFYTATDSCGFQKFPSLGLQAFNNRYILHAPQSNFHDRTSEFDFTFICTE
jgi:hypothetical protein